MSEQNADFEKKFTYALRASYPCLLVRSHEEWRVIRGIWNAIQQSKIPGMTLYQWDCVNQLEKIELNDKSKLVPKKHPAPSATPSAYMLTNILNSLLTLQGRFVVILKDFHHHIDNPGAQRQFRNLVEVLRAAGKMVVFLSPVIRIPTDIEKDVQIIDFNLPDEQQLGEILTSVWNQFNSSRKKENKPQIPMPEDARFAAIEAARGLTNIEAYDTYALAIIENEAIDKNFCLSVFRSKVTQVKRHGLLQYIHPDVTFDDVGGLKVLKDWIITRSKAYSTKAKQYGLPYPKGLLTCGITGTGKSLVAKATAAALGYPLFQLDIGSLFGSLVGQTEENLRRVTETLDAMGRCVVWIDEIEKSLSREATSGAGDTGTSSRAFATFLTWLSEHKTPVFVFATCNDYTRLPLEFVRKGRFDELFWLDLPTEGELTQIWEVLLRRYKRDAKKFNIPQLVSKTIGYTGAEVEQIIISALFSQFSEDETKDITTLNLIDAAINTTPVSKTAEAEIAKMREMVTGRLRFASGNPAEEPSTRGGEFGRKLETSN